MGDKAQKVPTNPKLIERVSRAICKADGNDPDQKCLRGGMQLAHLCGIASSATAAPRDCVLWPAWMLYAYIAETAIEELEAAAMEPFTLRPGTACADPVEAPVERTPWFPPATVREAWAAEVMHRQPSGPLRPTTPGGSDLTMGVPLEGKIAAYEAGQAAHLAKLREDMEKMAADMLGSAVFPEPAPAPKDAVLIDALRRQREKEGW